MVRRRRRQVQECPQGSTNRPPATRWPAPNPTLRNTPGAATGNSAPGPDSAVPSSRRTARTVLRRTRRSRPRVERMPRDLRQIRRRYPHRLLRPVDAQSVVQRIDRVDPPVSHFHHGLLNRKFLNGALVARLGWVRTELPVHGERDRVTDDVLKEVVVGSRDRRNATRQSISRRVIAQDLPRTRIETFRHRV